MKYNIIMNAIQKAVTVMRVKSDTESTVYVHSEVEKYLNDGWRVVQISTCDNSVNDDNLSTINTHRFFTTYLLEKSVSD